MLQRYDVIGDVHGCLDALQRLGAELGYDADFRHPAGRIPVFVGDLINRGPDSVGVVRLMLDLVRSGGALTVLGNHDDAMHRYLQGEDVNLNDGGLARTIDTFQSLPDSKSFMADLKRLYDNTPLCLSLDGGALLVVHAGIEDWILAHYRMPDEACLIGREPDSARSCPGRPGQVPAELAVRGPGEARRFILHGDAIGKSPEGKTLRRDWAATYSGAAFVVYGHTPQPDAVIRYNTVNIDTGAYRGGKLTAMRWPERTIVAVPSLYSNVGR